MLVGLSRWCKESRLFFSCVFFPPPLQAKFRSQGRKGLTFLMSYRDTLKPSKELQGGPKTSYKKVITPLIGDPFYPNYPFIYRAIGFITIEGYKGQFNKDLLSSRCHPSGKVFPPSSSLVAHETPAPARLQKDMTWSQPKLERPTRWARLPVINGLINGQLGW